MKIFLGIFAVVMIAILLLSYGIRSGDRRAEEQERASPTCKSNWTLCKDGPEVVERYKGKEQKSYFDPRFDCERATEDAVKYGKPQWPNTGYNFNSVEYAIKNGKLRLAEKNARLQNGFGVTAKAISSVNSI